MTTPCGQPEPATCPGPAVTLDTHQHQAPPEGQRHSKGAKTHRAIAPHSGYDTYDAQTSNWCPTCQETLLRCSRAGCPRAHETATVYVYVAAAFALALARKTSFEPWTGEQEGLAEGVVRTRALSRLNGPSSDPDRWHPGSRPASSLINWFGYKMDGDIRTKLANAETETRLIKPARPADEHPKPNSSTPVGRRENMPSGPDAWKKIPSHRRSPENAAVFYDENQRLSAQWHDLVDTILDELGPQRSHGAAPPPALLMLCYLADFADNRTYTDELYGIGRTSDRDIAYQLGIGNSAISRTRKEVLIPTCENLLSDAQLTDPQREALTSIINHLHGHPIKEAPPAKAPARSAHINAPATPEAGTP